jgi:thiosulfate/3-mercaptopyruvate sulfurtransferase
VADGSTTSPLVSTDWLAEHLDHSILRLADTRWYLGEPERGREAFLEAHIPGAVYVDLDTELSAEDGPGRHPLPDWETFAVRMGRLGIGDQNRVVAYDDRGGAIASRLWWMLRAIGHEHSYVLDGGLNAWTEDGHPVSDHVISHPEADLSVSLQPGLTVDRDQLRERLGSILTLDARSGDRYRGEVEPIDPVAGHIPTAISADYVGNLGPDQRFLPVDELTARYRSLGVDGSGTVVAYCGSGVTACHNALAMEHAGLGRPLLYPGSWSDWSTAGFPVATGPDPGEPSG